MSGPGAFAASAFQHDAFQVSQQGTVVGSDVAVTTLTVGAGLANGGTLVANIYDVGDVARITGAFEQDGVAIDPDAITLTIRRPDGVIATSTYGSDDIVRSEAGSYYFDEPMAQAGTYWYRWVATGVGASAEEGRLVVRPSAVTEY